jgi:uncharacterized protein
MAAPLPEVVLFLLDPHSYPDHIDEVKLIQTQMSFVFLAGKLVYKIKKRVNLGYLDYTSLEKRRFFCEQEVALNRRLCPGSYLGVVPITRSNSALTLGGPGEIIDYAVKMFRLPQERMLDFLLEHHQATPEMIQRLAAKLADFHTGAETGPAVSRFGQLSNIRCNTEENFNQTEKYIGLTITGTQFRQIKQFSLDTLREKADVFKERAGSGRIKDCHGDLHSAHICFTDSICIFDCIEFNDRFRFIDVIADIAFLAMDLDHFERPDLSQRLIGTYYELSRDRRIPDLLNFYKCYRAYVRGKVESFRYEDQYVSAAEKEQALAAARSYFRLAEFYFCEPAYPV